MSQYDHVTRVVLVDNNGRVYDQRVEKLEFSFQDDGQTLKVSITKKHPSRSRYGWRTTAVNDNEPLPGFKEF